MYIPGYNRGILYNLGYLQAIKNAVHNWNSSSEDIHTFNYDYSSGGLKNLCNGGEMNDIVGWMHTHIYHDHLQSTNTVYQIKD